MKARLVQLEGNRRVGSTRIEDAPITIGRDSQCDVVVPDARVSRLHARIEMLGGVHYVVDLESVNGTRLRGEPLHARAALEPGDRIQIADDVFVYETVPDVPWLWIGGALALVVGVALALLMFSLRDPVWDEAVRLAAEAVAADDRADYPVARQRLKSAVGLLLREGRLDDVSRNEVVEVAMRRLGERLEGEVDLAEIFARSHERTEPPPAPRSDECRLDRVSVADFDRCLRERVELVMIGLRQDPAQVPPRFYAQVARRLDSEREFLTSALSRGARYREMMSEELQRAYMPPLLRYLACIESGYRAEVRSSAGAVGLWQFMPGTARDYGLHIDGPRDERTDPQKSTRAAARYLRSLAFEFGGESLMLVLASYNRGENGVRRALKRLEDPYSDRSYWALVEAGYLPQETAEYVTRFVAAAVAGEAGIPGEAVVRAAGY